MDSKVGQIQAAAIGALVWWDFDEIRVKPDDARNALAASGLAISVPVLDPVSMLRKSASEFRPSGLPRGEAWKAEFIRQYPDGTVEIALLRHVELSKDKAAAKKVAWTQEDSVVFDTNSGGWLYSGKTQVAGQFIAAATDRMTFLGSDFVRSQIVDRPLQAAGAFTLRKRLGGFYFAPASVIPLAEQIQTFVQSLPGADATIHIAHMQPTDQTARAVATSAREHVVGKIGDLMERINEWRKAARTPRSDAMANLLEDFGTLRDHAILYRDALGLALGDLESMVEAAAAEARSLAGLTSLGVPPVLVATISALVSAHGCDAPIGFATFVGTALPEEAATQKWWRTDRAINAAREAGYTIAVDRPGVTFTPIDGGPVTPSPAPQGDQGERSEPEPSLPPEPDATPAEVSPAATTVEPSDDFGGGWAADEDPAQAAPEQTDRERIESMTVKQLIRALDLLGHKPDPKAKKADLVRDLLDASGL